MASIDQKIGFVSGQIPQKMAVHKDIPFWESIESHYNSIRKRRFIQAKEEAYHRAKASFEKDHKELFVQINNSFKIWKKASLTLSEKWRRPLPTWHAH